jgi:RNA 2',3'-cyclic 3'-phosphodiesterase
VTAAGEGADAAAETARLFVAMPVAAEVRDGLEPVVAAVRGRADELSWTRPEGWHLTLAFLGRVEVARTDEVVAAVEEAVTGAPPLRLRLREPGRFGPRVLWIAVGEEPEGALVSLGERIQVAIAAAGLPVERRPVRPHLTLARGGRGRSVRDRYLDDLADVLGRAPAVAGSAWVADDVQLWRSRLGRGPARYDALATIPLRG